MANTLAAAIAARLDGLADNAHSDYAEQVVEGHRAHLDSNWGLVDLALELDLDPTLPCYVARAEGSRACGPFDTIAEANRFLDGDDRYEVEQITIGDAARLFPSCAPRVMAAPTPLAASVVLPVSVALIRRLQSMAGA